jgi:sialic acid synthase SpsE
MQHNNKIINKKECFIIAEIGSVHDGNFKLAKKLIDAVSKTGADAVKFQIHIPEAETLKNAPMPPFFKGEPRFKYFKRTGYSKENWKKLKKYSEKKGLVFLASSFSIAATNLLNDLEVVVHKVPSGEVTNIPYLEHMAKSKKPILLSSGMSNWQELDQAVKTIKKYNKNLILLQCTTEYPMDSKNAGLNIISEMKSRYKTMVGYSGHSLNNHIAYASIVLGAKVIEKHFTLSRDMYGSDAKHSMLPNEFKELVDGIKNIEKALNNKVDKNNLSKFKIIKKVFEKSIVSLQDIEKDKKINSKMIDCKKPGTGIPPKYFKSMIGKIATRNIKKDCLITWKDIKK